MAIELDCKNIHLSMTDLEKDAEKLKRSETFFQTGILVLRFMNKEVFSNLSGVCEYIDYVVKQRLKELRSSQSQELYL